MQSSQPAKRDRRSCYKGDISPKKNNIAIRAMEENPGDFSPKKNNIAIRAMEENPGDFSPNKNNIAIRAMEENPDIDKEIAEHYHPSGCAETTAV
ncbi:hypothetical protein DPMN_021482 [Dreissena polymorpha]|uniref:Uncharacterized protein n=1 Tax=Dreissena polymorpha TaxID=45954 RepID=A0A9D4NMT2_DREPO|nr:hypothetical protein DPMN_021482 [Dreissena polymorpha]